MEYKVRLGMRLLEIVLLTCCRLTHPSCPIFKKTWKKHIARLCLRLKSRRTIGSVVDHLNIYRIHYIPRSELTQLCHQPSNNIVCFALK